MIVDIFGLLNEDAEIDFVNAAISVESAKLNGNVSTFLLTVMLGLDNW